jgi:hypothetical protein
VAVGRDAVIRHGVSLSEDVKVGTNCWVRPGATIKRSILLAGASVGDQLSRGLHHRPRLPCASGREDKRRHAHRRTITRAEIDFVVTWFVSRDTNTGLLKSPAEEIQPTVGSLAKGTAPSSNLLEMILPRSRSRGSETSGLDDYPL